jgi:hypothetical protein
VSALPGNGFDFQINPFRFGGMEGSVTSPPYPVVAEEEFASRVEGAFDTTILQNLEEFTTTSVALSGEIRDTLIRYAEGPESIDSTTAVALSGQIQAILKVYSEGPESIDSNTALALSGQINRILIVTTMEADEFNSVMAVALGGTLQ